MPGKGFNFFKELKRRKVYRVATVYAITGWIIAQIAAVTFPHLNLPNWFITAIIVLVIIGFPVALVLAWAFEVSPDGIIRTTSVDADNNPLPDHKRKPFTGTTTIIVSVVLLIAQFVYFQFIRDSNGKKETIFSEASLFPQKSIAVLPFKNMSKDEDNVYFSDGVMEAILNNLSRIKDLKVVSRTSVEQYRDKDIPIKTIANNLEVANVLEGSVQKVGNAVRIVVQLIDAKKDKHIWATHYDRDISDLFEVQSEIAKTIAGNLKVILTTDEREIIENAPTSNLLAYDLYLNAISKYPENKVEFERGIKMLQEVIKLDSNFAWPYSKIGNYLYRMKNYGAPRNIWVDSALVVLDKSIELDPANAEAYSYKSYIYYDLYEFEKQEDCLIKGLNFDPNDYFLLRDLGNLYLKTGDYDQGISLLLKSFSVNKPDKTTQNYFLGLGDIFFDIDLDYSLKILKEGLKLYPESNQILDLLARNYMFNSDFEESRYYTQKRFSLKLDFVHGYTIIAYSYFFTKNYKLAEEYYLKDQQLSHNRDSLHPYHSIQRLGYAQIQNGKLKEGRKNIEIFREMIEKNIENKEMAGDILVPGYYDMGTMAAFNGEKEKAISYLNKAWDSGERGNFIYLMLSHDPFWDNMRNDEQFKDMFKKYQDEEALKKKLLKEKLIDYHARNELKWIKLD